MGNELAYIFQGVSLNDFPAEPNEKLLPIPIQIVVWLRRGPEEGVYRIVLGL